MLNTTSQIMAQFTSSGCHAPLLKAASCSKGSIATCLSSALTSMVRSRGSVARWSLGTYPASRPQCLRGYDSRPSSFVPSYHLAGSCIILTLYIFLNQAFPHPTRFCHDVPLSRLSLYRKTHQTHPPCVYQVFSKVRSLALQDAPQPELCQHFCQSLSPHSIAVPFSMTVSLSFSNLPVLPRLISLFFPHFTSQGLSIMSAPLLRTISPTCAL